MTCHLIFAAALLLMNRVLGCYDPVPHPRIIGGEFTDIRKYPHQVALLYRGKLNCGGSIVKENFVVTAAHCVDKKDASALAIRAGSSNYNSNGIIVSIANIHQHPCYVKGSYDYDVAILELSKPVKFGPGIDAIELPNSNEFLMEGTNTIVTGWGSVFELGKASQILQYVVVPVVNQEVCQQNYPDNTITERMVCAGFSAGQKDACKGDSGGPMIADGKLVGVVSWGKGCGKPNRPGVYTRVSIVRAFITKIIAS